MNNFHILFVLGVIFSSFTVIANNPVISLISLIFLFLNSCILLITFEVEFLSFIIIIIYLGAVTILFIFTLILLNIKNYELNQINFKYYPSSFLLILTFFVIIMWFSFHYGSLNWLNRVEYEWINQMNSILIVEGIGLLLFKLEINYLIFSSLILLLSMIAAISITLVNEEPILKQNISFQILSSDKIFLKDRK